MQKPQYAKLPKFEYQTIQPHYQTFDLRTAKFSSYPVNAAASSVRLTPNNNQDTNPAETENPVPEDAPAGDESSGAPADSSEPAEAGG